MRKKTWIMICLTFIITISCSLFSVNISKVMADEPDHATLGEHIPRAFFDDDKMFLALIECYNQNKPDGEEYNNNGKIYYNMFQVAGIKTLNLEGLSTRQITKITDLVNINVSEIEELNLSFNSIVGNVDLTDFTALKNLYINNNKITGIDVSGLLNLQTIIASNNELSGIDLSGFTGSTVDLSMNRLVSIEDITLPAQTVTCSIDLINNNITDVTSTTKGNISLNLGVQGISRVDGPICSGEIVFYNIKKDGVKAVVSGNDKVFSSIDYAEDIKKVTLAPGNYSLTYKYSADDSNVWSENIIYTTSTIWSAGYESVNFVIKPEKPRYTFFVNGEEKSSLSQIVDDTEFQGLFGSGATGYISYDGETWTEYSGEKISLEKKTVNIYLKAKQNGVESDVVQITAIYVKEPFPAWLSIIIIVAGVAVIIVGMVLVKKYIIDRGPAVQE